MDESNLTTYTLTDAARLMNVSKPTMLKLANRSDFPSIRIGSRWIINAAGLQRWLDDQVMLKAETEPPLSTTH